MLIITTTLHCISISCLNILLDYQYQDLNTSNKPVKLVKPVKELSDKSNANNIL